MIWTILLLFNVILFFLLFSDRTRSKREPPLDKGIIPWLGHALDFGKDAAKFLTRMRMKHGDIFTVRVAGRYVTVLLDPRSFDSVIRDTTSLDFSRYAQILMERIFGLQLPNHSSDKEKAIMRRHFHGEGLASLNDTMQRNLRVLLTSEMLPDQTDWKRDGLFNFCYSLLFRAGYLTLFGGEQNNNKTDATNVYEDYRRFEGLLTKLARKTLKSGERQAVFSVRQRLWALLALSGLREDSSLWLRDYRRLLREEGFDEETQRRALLMQLWATQGNVGPAMFWMLAYLLTHADALTAVKKELSRVTLPGGVFLDPKQPTPVFDSTLEETLRLTAAPFITREVLQDKTLVMADGQEYDLRKGDRLCLFPFVSPQNDPEIHPEPEKFKYDRFLNADGTPKSDFYKGGRRLKYYTLPWGAGRNGCMGKQFAINTMKQFVFLVLFHVDMELCDPKSGIPGFDTSRYGFGMVQPDREMFVRYKLKAQSRIH
ncbi:prostacyclin synthase-like [Chanos chanos]|uniref:Prostacyclin synthase n=1 Tax=Chanos chanos TaxID=29144 RepID=A0A6J2VNX8_CHACN|nr:prostacyclin synthase-like [Chanos chanos]